MTRCLKRIHLKQELTLSPDKASLQVKTLPGKSGLNHQEMDNKKIEIVGNKIRRESLVSL